MCKLFMYHLSKTPSSSYAGSTLTQHVIVKCLIFLFRLSLLHNVLLVPFLPLRTARQTQDRLDLLLVRCSFRSFHEGHVQRRLRVFSHGTLPASIGHVRVHAEHVPNDSYRRRPGYHGRLGSQVVQRTPDPLHLLAVVVPRRKRMRAPRPLLLLPHPIPGDLLHEVRQIRPPHLRVTLHALQRVARPLGRHGVELPSPFQRLGRSPQVAHRPAECQVAKRAVVQDQSRLGGHLVRRLGGIGLHVQELLHDGGSLELTSDVEKDGDDASHLMPEEGITHDFHVAHIVGGGDGREHVVVLFHGGPGLSHFHRVRFLRTRHPAADQGPFEVDHLLAVHLTKVAEVVSSHHVLQTLGHGGQLEIPSGEEVSVGSFGAGEAGAELGRDGAPSQDSNGGREYVVEDAWIVVFGDCFALEGRSRIVVIVAVSIAFAFLGPLLQWHQTIQPIQRIIR
mmetsp:Transcript_13994/g.29919  ORF Transcript_13994/g.29919 Transcript_13994/m.29919 type:complete len:449 (-) Transcript_13994:633-1979(-)